MGGITTTLFQRPRDPQFNNTTLLLSGNFPTNGAQNNTFLDSSSNAFSITRNPTTGPDAPTQGTFSPFSQTGWSVFFNNTDFTNIYAASSADFNFGSGDFTIECFFNSSNAMSTATFYRLFDTGQLSCFFFSGNIYLRNAAANELVTVVAHGLSVGVWYHLAFVRSGTTYSIYRNGSLLTSGTGGTVTSASAPFVIGTNTSYNQSLSGYVSDFRVTTGQALYTTTFTPATTQLTTTSQGATASNVKLLTCQSNRFVDNSTQSTKTILVGDNGSNLGTRFIQAFEPFAPSGAYTTTAVGGSGYFVGADTGLTVAGGSSLAFGSGDFSLEAFVYPTASGSAMKIYDGRNSSTTADCPILERLASNVASFSGLITGTTVIPQNAWTHILLSRVSGNIRLFINGVQDGSTVANSTNFLNGTARPAIAVRGTTLQNDEFFGYISSLRVLIGSGFTSVTVPTAPPSPVGSSLCLNFTNAGIIDSTTKNVLETVGNAQISTTQSKFGGSSMYFDGTGDYLRIPTSQINSLGSGSWTIEFWIYRVGSGNQIFYDQRSTATQVAVTIFNDGTNILRFFVNGANRISDTTTFPSSTWTHVAVCKSGSSTRMFVNGTQVGSTYTDTNAYVNNPIFIGAQFDGSGTLNGYIDDLRITNGVARYTANFNVPTIGFTDR